eukprot:scaffold14501_cov56-Phaeocystis_antarctica.AAC.4
MTWAIPCSTASSFPRSFSPVAIPASFASSARSTSSARSSSERTSIALRGWVPSLLPHHWVPHLRSRPIALPPAPSSDPVLGHRTPLATGALSEMGLRPRSGSDPRQNQMAGRVGAMPPVL